MTDSRYWVFLKPVTETVEILNDWAKIFQIENMEVDNKEDLIESMKELKESAENVLKALGE